MDHLGPFQILGPLGDGGMGAVYRAVHLPSGRAAAVSVWSRSPRLSYGLFKTLGRVGGDELGTSGI